MADYFDTADNAALGGLGAAFKSAIQGWQDAEDRNMKRLEMESKLEAQKHERERHKFLDGLTARHQGFQVPQGGELYKTDPSQLQYDPEYLALQEQKLNADPFGLKGIQRKNADLEGVKKRQDIAEAAEAARRKSLSPIQGYQKTDSYVAGPVEEQHLRNAQASVAKFNQLMSNLKARVQAASRKELLNPVSNTAKAIKNDLRDLQLTYKNEDFAKLGVLTGPDLRLLEEVIENPGTISNLISGKEGVIERYDQALERVNSGFANKVSALGLVPMQAPQAPAGNKSQGSGLLGSGKLNSGLLSAPQKPASGPKPGDVDGDYVFQGGDPADPKNWKKK